MPRLPRKKSSTGIYHITMRGVNKSNIFLEHEDYTTFLNYLQNIKESAGVEIYAYCLMTNHIHLLVKEVNEDLSKTIQRLGAGFVGWYNRKYERVGHLFQSRYGSEVVETDAYLLMISRYVHQNPVKAGLARKVIDYPWSSIREYRGRPRICNTQFLLAYFGKPDSLTARREMLLAQEYEVAGEKEAMDRVASIITPEEIQMFFHEVCKDLPWEERERMNKNERLIWAELLLRHGASYRQIETITGISRFILNKYRTQ